MKPHQGAPPLTLVGDYGDDDYVDDDVYGDLDMQVFIKDRETSSRSSTLAIGTEHWSVATTVSTAAFREFICTNLREFFGKYFLREFICTIFREFICTNLKEFFAQI